MRFKYLAILTTVSILSLGFVGACANPCAANTTTPTNQTDPCASKTDPCAAKTDPCASKK